MVIATASRAVNAVTITNAMAINRLKTRCLSIQGSFHGKDFFTSLHCRLITTTHHGEGAWLASRHAASSLNDTSKHSSIGATPEAVSTVLVNPPRGSE